MFNVYWIKLADHAPAAEISSAARRLFEIVVEKENVTLEREVPLKVHFGERGNETWVRPGCYDGIIDYLEAHGVKSSFMETSVLYGGPRAKRGSHEQLAREHGFTRLPVVIADGEAGESFAEVEIDKKHFKTCKIGAEFAKYKQLIVLSHFKGHRLAGFGGAVKQLSMGCAAKGGKLAMHMGIKPYILNFLCKKCGLCKTGCGQDAITIGPRSFIDREKCVGCGACFALCPHHAVSIYSFESVFRALLKRGDFLERLAEHAYAAQLGKHNIYVTFAVNITKNCDCIGHKMAPAIGDFGVFASTDPVAIDQACCDMAKEKGYAVKGLHQLEYGEEIGLGSTKYRLIGK
jgi:uncharacterized Fe-S center protein